MDRQKGLSSISKKFTLGIPIDLSYSTNRIIVGLSLISFAVVLVYRLIIGTSFISASYIAAAAGFAVFLNWASGREIDPANDWSAFVALPVTFLIALLYGPPAFIALLFILLFSRILNGTTGMQATAIDSAIILILGGVLHYDGIITALPILTVVFILDALLKPVNRRQVYFALAAILMFGAMLVFLPGEPPLLQNLSPCAVFASFLLITAAAIVIYLAKDDRTYNYQGGFMLQASRIIVSQVLIVFFILAELFIKGSIALLFFYPAAAAYCGAALYHVVASVRDKRLNKLFISR